MMSAETNNGDAWMKQVLQAKTKDAVDILETSFILKKTRFISHEGEKPVQAGRDPKDVIPVKSFFSLFKYVMMTSLRHQLSAILVRNF
jgi:hypothetical protein